MGSQWHWQLHSSPHPLGTHLEILQRRLTLVTRHGNSKSILLVSVLPFSDTSFQKNIGSITINMSQVFASCSNGWSLQAILQRGHRLLCEFVQEFEQLYYQCRADQIHFVRQSIHLLTHLASEIIRIGPLVFLLLSVDNRDGYWEPWRRNSPES